MPIDQDAIVSAVAGLDLRGNEEGLIPAFGLYLTRHYADYYNRASFEYLHAAENRGAAQARDARRALTEAGHICAFNTFGGIMLSQEWDAVVMPMIQTREDWVAGIVAVINAFGWGRWSLAGLRPNRDFELIVDHSYESEGYLRDYPRRDPEQGGVCFLATGGVAGIMNLLYHGDITQRPSLNESYYTRLFQGTGRFVGEELECRTHGAPRCRFVARRSEIR
jgi:hypothetical protein